MGAIEPLVERFARCLCTCDPDADQSYFLTGWGQLEAQLRLIAGSPLLCQTASRSLRWRLATRSRRIMRHGPATRIGAFVFRCCVTSCDAMIHGPNIPNAKPKMLYFPCDISWCTQRNAVRFGATQCTLKAQYDAVRRASAFAVHCDALRLVAAMRRSAKCMMQCDASQRCGAVRCGAAEAVARGPYVNVADLLCIPGHDRKRVERISALVIGQNHRASGLNDGLLKQARSAGGAGGMRGGEGGGGGTRGEEGEGPEERRRREEGREGGGGRDARGGAEGCEGRSGGMRGEERRDARGGAGGMRGEERRDARGGAEGCEGRSGRDARGGAGGTRVEKTGKAERVADMGWKALFAIAFWLVSHIGRTR